MHRLELPPATPARPLRVLMVCMGNICRSPTAHGVLERKIADAGLADRIQVDSAGTHDYHVGRPPDERAQAHALRRGVNLSAQRARQLTRRDFADFDLVLVMDEANRNGARVPVTALVDQFYADVQQAGGRRFDTSSLITRLK